MRKKYDLQLFADGGEGGSEGQSGNAGAGNGDQSSAGKGSYSFEQAEEIANARAERASKAALKSYFQQQGMSEQEVEQALADFKKNKEKNKPNISAIEQERDDAKRELQEYKNGAYLTGKGVSKDDADYVRFKVDALAKEKNLSFEKAADQFLKDNPRYAGKGYTVNTSTPSGSNGNAKNENFDINSAIRRAAGRTGV